MWRLSFFLLPLLAVGCTHSAASMEGNPDTTPSSADARAPEIGAPEIGAAETGTPDAGAPVDGSSSDATYTLTTGQCFTFATASIGDGSVDRCGDFTLEGASSPFLVGIDGTMCQLEGTYTKLDSVPTAADACGRIINLGGDKNLGFIVKVDAKHHYRVHVRESLPNLVFSFRRID